MKKPSILKVRKILYVIQPDLIATGGNGLFYCFAQ
jgi:hypothetical protein